ncbi:hypothetical protein [Halorarius litoreus]|uniref:hypothetical protein n=1 Tax=Halorarius litoreus TaxID=2962676 RepID=UPI0020CFE100|nr:hypothetical protein [Halorarius litoreus]
MRWRLVVPVLALVLAGCSGFGGLDGSGDSRTTTLTPVDVPERSTAVDATPSTATAENRLLPGLTTEGVTDPFVLADAHHDLLANRSYTRITDRTLDGPNGTLRSTHQELRVAEGGRRYHLTATSESAPSYPVSAVASRLGLWYDDAPALFRVGQGENVSYRVGMTGSLDGPVGDITGEDRLVGLYGTVDRWSVKPMVSWNNQRLLVLESREPPDHDVLRLPTLVEEPRDAELQVVLTNDGGVVSHRLRYNATFDGQPVRVVEHVRYVQVGSTTVDEPAWLDEAIEETIDDRRGSG